MDQPLSPLDAVRPWKTATLVASAVAALELAVIVAAGVVVLGRTLAKHGPRRATAHAVAPAPHLAVPPTAAPRANAAAGKPTRTRAQTVVTVLNGGHVAGSAARHAEELRRLGYRIGPVGNSRVAVTQTAVEYRPGFRAEAARLAADLHVATVSPLDGLRPSDLAGAQVALLLGT